MILSELLLFIFPELYPRIDYNVVDEGEGPYIAEWNTDKYPKPTIEELEARIPEIQADYDLAQVRRKRILEYPKLTDQLDMLWHAMDEDRLPKDNDFYTAIKAVKDKYPKE